MSIESWFSLLWLEGRWWEQLVAQYDLVSSFWTKTLPSKLGIITRPINEVNCPLICVTVCLTRVWIQVPESESESESFQKQRMGWIWRKANLFTSGLFSIELTLLIPLIFKAELMPHICLDVGSASNFVSCESGRGGPWNLALWKSTAMRER